MRIATLTVAIIVGLAYLMNYSGLAYTLGLGVAVNDAVPDTVPVDVRVAVELAAAVRVTDADREADGLGSADLVADVLAVFDARE